jgi:hypothetical protein
MGQLRASRCHRLICKQHSSAPQHLHTLWAQLKKRQGQQHRGELPLLQCSRCSMPGGAGSHHSFHLALGVHPGQACLSWHEQVVERYRCILQV